MNIDSPKRSLRQEGVPLGVRWALRAQHFGFVLMSILLVFTLPFAAVWAMVHESGVRFLEGAQEVVTDRFNRMKEHRARVVAMYGRRNG